jgi:hypothetical protein
MGGSAAMIAQAASSFGGTLKGGIDFLSASKQLKADKEELARLEPVFYQVRDEYYGNRNSAAENAQSGITQGAKDYFTDMSSRGLGTAVSGVSAAGGSVNDINRIFQSYNDSMRRFSAEDSEKHLNNIQYYQQVNKDLAAQKNIQWAVNEYQPYQNKLKELTQRIAADKLNKNNALNDVISGIGMAGQAFSNDNMHGKLFGDEAGSVTAPDNSGQAGWEEYKRQQQMNDAAQGDQMLSQKFSANKFQIPDDLGLSEEQKAGLYNYLNRGQ